MRRAWLRVPEQRADHRQREAGAGEQARVGVPEDRATRTPVMPAALQIFGQGFLRSTRSCAAVPARKYELGIVGAPRRESPSAARAPAPTAGRGARSSASSCGPASSRRPARGRIWSHLAPNTSPLRAPVSSSRRMMFATSWSS